MASSLKQVAICVLLCTLVLNANSRYVSKRQSEQQQQDEVEEFQGEVQAQEQGAGSAGGVGGADEGELVQLAVQEAEQNPDIVTGDLNDQELNQFEQDLGKYENQLAQEAEQAGHKGVVTKEDIQHVQEKNEKKPWYIRLRNWAGRKLNELTDAITKY